MDCQCIPACNYILVYDWWHSSQHYIHKLPDTDQRIYFCCMPKPRDSPNRLSIQVYNLGKGHRNNQANMSMIRRFLALYILHSHHKGMVHMGLDIRPLVELKCVSNRMNWLTDKHVSHRGSTSCSEALVEACWAWRRLVTSLFLLQRHYLKQRRPKAAVMADSLSFTVSARLSPRAP